ncbi:MAG: DUF4292 domain-containing protein [Flavobacteriaceae bacterium]|nr:DUF4292 domain-containing protein [Flavobacteriaceae bacterium]
MRLKYISVLFCLILIASCTIQRGENVVRKHKRMKAMSSAKLYKETVANYLDYTTINLKKINITYEEGDKKQNFRGSVRILKDSIIWLSVSKMGIEGLRVKLTPQKVALIDRLHREYLITDYSYLNDKFNVELNFYLLQNVLTNQLPEYRLVGDLPFYKNFKGKKTGKHYIFYSKKRKDKKYWKEQKNTNGNIGSTLEILRITPDLMRLESIDIFETQFFTNNGVEQTVNFNLKYEDYKRFNEQHLFPQKITSTIQRKLRKGKTDYSHDKIKLTILVERMEVNDSKLSFPFTISRKYKQINE